MASLPDRRRSPAWRRAVPLVQSWILSGAGRWVAGRRPQSGRGLWRTQAGAQPHPRWGCAGTNLNLSRILVLWCFPAVACGFGGRGVLWLRALPVGVAASPGALAVRRSLKRQYWPVWEVGPFDGRAWRRHYFFKKEKNKLPPPTPARKEM